MNQPLRSHPGIAVAVVLLGLALGCGPTGRTCDVSTCPSGCCDANDVCQSGTSTAACGTNGTTCKSCGLACSDGQCTEDTQGSGGGGGGATGGGAGGSAGTCAAPAITVQGTLPTPTGGVNIAYDSLSAIDVSHKRDVDPVEDGCIANLDFTVLAKGQCKLRIVAGGKKLANGALVVKSVELIANSQCAGFLDAKEGTYENTGGLTEAEVLLSSPSVPGHNTAQSCVTTTLSLKLSGALNRKTDNALLQVSSAQLTISGQFSSKGDVALSCPQLCTSGNCLPQAYWQDPVTHLKWEHPAKFALPLQTGSQGQARAYCAALTTGGVPAGTWRLPTIDELRTLIRNFPATQPGGSCKVCENCAVPCLDFTCYSGCSASSGVSSCLFMEPALGTECTTPFHVWSTSPVTDYPGSYWSVVFYDAGISGVATEGGARCVR